MSKGLAYQGKKGKQTCLTQYPSGSSRKVAEGEGGVWTGGAAGFLFRLLIPPALPCPMPRTYLGTFPLSIFKLAVCKSRTWMQQSIACTAVAHIYTEKCSSKSSNGEATNQ